MIFEFAQKLFPTQYLLPLYRFERIFNLTNQPLFHPATILPSLPAPTGIGLEDPLNRFTVEKRYHFSPIRRNPVAAPTVLSQMKMILHQEITMHLHPVALCAFSEIAQKLRPISIIAENLSPSISARHDVVDRTGKLNPRSRDTLLCHT